jgi:hypothetical protein
VAAATTRMCRLNEQQEAGSGVGSADADVVQAAIDAQGDGADGAGGVDGVVADAVAGAATRRLRGALTSR